MNIAAACYGFSLDSICYQVQQGSKFVFAPFFSHEIESQYQTLVRAGAVLSRGYLMF